MLGAKARIVLTIVRICVIVSISNLGIGVFWNILVNQEYERGDDHVQPGIFSTLSTVQDNF